MGEIRKTVRLPVDVAQYLTEQSKWNFTSINAEVVRSVRERMSAEEAARADAGSAPASGGQKE
ncbi:hypothetical protein M728_000356 [Ensifer sp. WSM1721]|uniref:hypothetical protein n=1 Tax=Ensifer sp. WSM1721 TaxID=1041159 RepID=UPI0004B46728|nr:hypothetical protein [Ensifer sp. WSM1721]